MWNGQIQQKQKLVWTPSGTSNRQWQYKNLVGFQNTHQVTEARMSDIVIVDKRNTETIIINISVSGDNQKKIWQL